MSLKWKFGWDFRWNFGRLFFLELQSKNWLVLVLVGFAISGPSSSIPIPISNLVWTCRQLLPIFGDLIAKFSVRAKDFGLFWSILADFFWPFLVIYHPILNGGERSGSISVDFGQFGWFTCQIWLIFSNIWSKLVTIFSLPIFGDFSKRVTNWNLVLQLWVLRFSMGANGLKFGTPILFLVIFGRPREGRGWNELKFGSVVSIGGQWLGHSTNQSAVTVQTVQNRNQTNF